jgi:hypothetical protein
MELVNTVLNGAEGVIRGRAGTLVVTIEGDEILGHLTLPPT